MARQPTLAQQLGIGDDPVQPKAFSRANLQLRPANVRGGLWRPAVPGTLSASETPLGRLAGALAAGGGLIGQVAALKSKKAELEERGLSITHQQALAGMQGQIADEKLTQLGHSLDMANQRTYEAQKWSDYNSLTVEEREAYSTQVESEQQTLSREVAEADRSLLKARNEAIETNISNNGSSTSNSDPAVKEMVNEAFLGNRAADILRTEVQVELEKISEGKDAKGNPNLINENEFAGVISGIVFKLKKEKDISHGTEADRAFNKSVSAFSVRYLPSIKKAFFDVQDHQQRARINQFGSDAVDGEQALDELQNLLLGPNYDKTADYVFGKGPLAELMKLLGPEIKAGVTPTAALFALDSNYSVWRAAVVKLGPEELEKQLEFGVRAFLAEGLPGIEKARILTTILDKDPKFRHRGVRYLESSHGRVMQYLISETASKLDDDAGNEAGKLANAFMNKVRPDMVQSMGGMAPSERTAQLFNFQQALGNGDLSVFSNFLNTDEPLFKEIMRQDKNVAPLLISRAINEMFTMSGQIGSVQTAVLGAILGDSPTISGSAQQDDILALVGGGQGFIDPNNEALIKAMGMTSGPFDTTALTEADLIGTAKRMTDWEVMTNVTSHARDEVNLLAYDYFDKVVKDYTEENGEAPNFGVLQQLTRERLKEIHGKGYLNIWARRFEDYASKKQAAIAARALRLKAAGTAIHDAELVDLPAQTPRDAGDAFLKVLEQNAESVREFEKKHGEGSPEMLTRLGIGQKGNRTASYAFLEAHDRAKTRSEEAFTETHKAVTAFISDVYVPLTMADVAEFRRNIHHDAPLDALEDPNDYEEARTHLNLKGKREEVGDKLTVLTGAYRDKVNFGMPVGDILNLLNTSYANGKPVNGFTLGLGETFLGPRAQMILDQEAEGEAPDFERGRKSVIGTTPLFDPVNSMIQRLRERVGGTMGAQPGLADMLDERGENHYRYVAQASSALPDHVIPKDFFSKGEVVPISELPVNGAIRNEFGKVTSVDLSVIELALGITPEDSDALARHYGYMTPGVPAPAVPDIGEDFAGTIDELNALKQHDARPQPDAVSFYFGQYKTAFHTARYYANQP